MTGSAVVDTILGLLATFYALALLCSGLVELIANWARKRAKYLLRGLRDLLEDPAGVDWSHSTVHPVANTTAEISRYGSALTAPLTPSGVPPRAAITVDDVMGHAMVQPYRHSTALGRPTRNPSYLPSAVFSAALVDLLTPGAAPSTLTIDDVQAGINALQNSHKLQQALSGLVKSARGDLETFIASTEVWFDTQMDRVTGSYKRWAKRWVIAIAVVIVGAGGIDAVAIARTFYANEGVRAVAVARVTDPAFCPKPVDRPACAQQAAQFLDTAGLPLGWSKPNPADGRWGWPLKVLGLLMSVGAAAVGAPFWYRLLDRVGSFRNTGRRPPEATRP